MDQKSLSQQNWKGGTGVSRSVETEEGIWKSSVRKPGNGPSLQTQQSIGPGFQIPRIPQQGPAGFQPGNSRRPGFAVQGGSPAYGQSTEFPAEIGMKPKSFRFPVPNAPPHPAFSDPEHSKEEMKESPQPIISKSRIGDTSKSNFPSFILDLPAPSMKLNVSNPPLEISALRKQPPVRRIERKVVCKLKQHEVDESESFCYVKCPSNCSVCATCVVEYCRKGEFRCPLCSRLYSRQEEALVSLYAQSLNVPYS